MTHFVGNKSRRVGDEPMKIPFKLLQEITNNFCEEQRLGSGAFGEVYKGVLDGKEIAVKRLRSMPGINEKQFETEFGHLKRLKHLNIVQLVGFCCEDEEVLVSHEGKEICAFDIHRALCLELMPNGSLGNCLSEQYLGLNWPIHFRIIKGICEGLKYLHDVSVMHFDLKPDNILLDENMVPKIADFGLSRLVGNENTIMTMSPLGTLGFLPPEFINKQVISKEYDIFSLGAIIKRIVTGAMDKESIPDMDQPDYVELVQNYWKEKLKEIPTKSFEAACKQVKTCLEIAVKCTEADRRKRPKMKDIICRLNEVEIKENDSWPQIDQWKPQASQRLRITLPKKLSSKYLEAITDGFSLERKLGQGSFGTMYKVTKGILEDGTEIVVEKLQENSSVVPDNEFQNVIGIFMALQHKNVVKLVGYCYESEKKVVEHNGVKILADIVESLLCFEYVPNGTTLRKYIYGESCQLDWNTRFRIIMGICQGLHFLKYNGGLSVHLELNPSNILLDNNMVPKIVGYGVRGLLSHGAQMKRRRIEGESIYKPPEYYSEGSMLGVSDIYYLGILIMEIATGEKYMPRNVCRDWTDEGIEWNYPSLDTTGINQVKTCIEIGLACVETNTRRTPRIDSIVNGLRETAYLDVMPEKIRSGTISFFRVQPRRLCFQYESKRLTSSLLYLTNSTVFRIVFSLQTETPRRYYTKLPFCGIVPPKCSYTLTVTMREQKKKTMFNSDEFLTLQSSIVPGQLLKNVNADSVAPFFEEVRKMAGSSTNERKVGCEVQEVRIPVVCNPPDVTTLDQSIQSAAAEIIASPNYRQVLSIDVHSTEPWILTTNNRGNVSIWNYQTKATVNSFEVNITEEPVYSAKFIEQEEWLLVGGGDGYIYVYSYEPSDTMEEIECFNAHDGHHIMSLAVKPTQSLVLSASDDRLIKLWNWEKGWECIQTFQGHYNKVTDVMFDPWDSNRFLSASLDRTVKIWSSDSPECQITLDGHPDGVISLQYLSGDNQQLLIAGSSDGSAKIWDLATEASVGMVDGDGEQLNTLCLHPELMVLIKGLHDGTVQILKFTSTSTYRLDNIIGFNLGAVKAVGRIKQIGRIVVACDQGLAMFEIKFLRRACLGDEEEEDGEGPDHEKYVNYREPRGHPVALATMQ